MGVISGRARRAIRRRPNADDQEWTFTQAGPRRHPDAPEVPLPERHPRRARASPSSRRSSSARATRTRSSARARRSSSRRRSSTPSSATSAASAPPSTPACASAASKSTLHRQRGSRSPAPMFMGGADITTGGIDRGQERGHRRRRPLVRHRAAEVRPRRRALRQLRPRLAQDRNAGAPRDEDEARPPRRSAASSCTWRATRSSRSAAATSVVERLRRRRAARLHRLHLRALDRRPRRRRLQGRRRPVPGRSRGLRRLRGRGRLPRARQRQGRHPRRRRQVPERSRDQERLPGRGRLPRQRRPSIATATASPTTSTSAPTIPRTRTTSRTRTAAPIPTTTRTASSTSTTSARTTPRTRTASRTRTAAPIPTTTRTASSTSTTSARTSPRPTTASRTTTAAPTRAGSSCARASSRSSTRSTSRPTRTRSSRVRSRSLDAIAATINGNPQIELIEIQGHADERGDDAHNLDLTERRAASVRRALEERNVAAEHAQEPRLRRDQADLHAAQRGLLEQEPPRRVHHREDRGRAEPSSRAAKASSASRSALSASHLRGRGADRPANTAAKSRP